MVKRRKLGLIIAVSLISIGLIFFGVIMTILKWDFTKLSTFKYETNNYAINENYKNITVITNTADIVLVPAKDSKTSVVCYEQANLKHSVSVKNQELVIEVVDTRKWYEHIGIDFNTPKITVYIPHGVYGTLLAKNHTGNIEIPKDFEFEKIDITASTGDATCYASALDSIKINLSTGDATIENVNAGSIDVSLSTGCVSAKSVKCEKDISITLSTGDCALNNVYCAALKSKASTGDITLEKVRATDSFNIERSTGDVNFLLSDAAEIIVKTDTGDVKGSLLSEKVFITETDTGDITVPKTTKGGKCEITTDTGDITIDISK